MKTEKRKLCGARWPVKRATWEWLRRLRAEDMDKSDHPATDILDSDARQRAEIRRLRAFTRDVASFKVSYDAIALRASRLLALRPTKRGAK